MATVEVGWHSQIIQTLSTRQHHSVDKARYLDRLSTDSRDFVDKFILSVTFFVLQPGSFLCHIDRAELVEISIFYDVSEKISKFVG